jgi:hypothetical protein
MKTFEVSTAQLESRFIAARQSGSETQSGGEKRRIVSKPLSSASKADINIIALSQGKFLTRGNGVFKRSKTPLPLSPSPFQERG